MIYFAYGSNMDSQQMRERCPEAEVIGIGYLPGYALCFPRSSKKRGCGVSSIELRTDHKTWGVLYRLSATDLASLDKNEGYLEGRESDLNAYNRVHVTVFADEQAVAAVTYIAEVQDAPLPPNLAYLTHLREGTLGIPDLPGRSFTRMKMVDQRA